MIQVKITTMRSMTTKMTMMMLMLIIMVIVMVMMVTFLYDIQKDTMTFEHVDM